MIYLRNTRRSKEGKSLSNEPVCFIVNGAIDRLDCTYNNPVYVDFYKKLKERSDTVDTETWDFARGIIIFRY